MARVLDAGDLPGLLARAAGVLEAPGVIVWVADRAGHALFPLLTHGYSRRGRGAHRQHPDRGRQRHRDGVADR